MYKTTAAGSGSEACGRNGDMVQDKFFETIALAFSESNSKPQVPTPLPRNDISHETIELPSMNSSTSTAANSDNTIAEIVTIDSVSNSRQNQKTSSKSILSEEDDHLLSSMTEKLGFGTISDDMAHVKAADSAGIDVNENSKAEANWGHRGSFARLARGVLQALTGTSRRAATRHRSPSLEDQEISSSSAPSKTLGPISIPVSGISQDVFSKALTKNELLKEFELMRNPFPNVPTFSGNPPWVTKYHPDLIKPPTRD